MTPPHEHDGDVHGSEPGNEPPGVPGFRRWRNVYVLVFAVFVLVVLGLAVLARVYA